MGKVSNAFDNVLNEYISFKDFLISISGKNKDPLYIALSYLISTKTYNDLQNSLYYIDIDYNINKIDVMPTVYGILKDLSSILFWNNQKWIYNGDMSYQNLQDDEVNRNIQTLMLVRISELNWFFFKKSDIYNNENLKIILNIKQSNTNAIDKITTLQNQLDQAHARIAELERQLSQREQEQYAPRHSHTNEALQALNDVINEFWQDPNNPPKQDFIKAHIVNNYLSIDPSKALWIDKIIRHNDKK